MAPRACSWIFATLFALATGFAVGRGADEPAAQRATLPPVHAYVAHPALAAAAETSGIALKSIELAEPGAPPAAGDSVVLFVILDEPGRQTQWLVQVRRVGDGVVRDDGRPPREVVLYSLDGRPIRFDERLERHELVSAGPYRGAEAEKPPAVRTVPVLMNTAYVDQRLDRAAGFMARVGRARHEGRLRADEYFTVFPRRPPEGSADARDRFVAEAGLTEADERAFAATVPALNEFVRVVSETPGVRDIFFAVVEKPSWWTLILRLGRLQTEFRFRSGEIVASPEPPLGFAGVGPCHIVPFSFSIEGRAALECTMLVAEPRPPLRITGGIVAVVATAPERPDTRLVVRVLASLPGAATRAPGNR